MTLKIKHLATYFIFSSFFFSFPIFAQKIDIIDDSGRRLHFASPPARIVSLSPHATELLFAVGAGEQVVAVDNWSNFPLEINELPRLGDMYSLHFERLLAQRPDLVVVWETGAQSRQAWRLRQLGLPVFVSAPQNFADIRRNAEMLAKLSRKPEIAHANLQQFAQKMHHLNQQQPPASEKIRVFVQIGTQPLISVGGAQFISQALELCQAENIFKNQKLMSFPVQKEQVAARAPDVILHFADAPQTPQFWAFLGEKTPHFLAVDADLLARPSFRLLDATQHICQKLQQIRQNRPPKT